MKAVILCGGHGTRIRDASESLPKPMLPIGGKPIVWHIMKLYAHYGIKDFVLCLGYKGWIIKEFFLNYRAMMTDITVHLNHPAAVDFNGSHDEEDWRITLAETGENTQTGGRLIAIRRYVERDPAFCLTYGDAVANVDIGSLVEFHRSNGKIATITAVRPPGRFGELRLAGTVVREFNEKPHTTEAFVNGGFMVIDTGRIWDYLGDNSQSILEREPLQRLACDDQLAAFAHTAFWQPMDTLREYTLLNELWLAGQAPWRIWADGGR